MLALRIIPVFEPFHASFCFLPGYDPSHRTLSSFEAPLCQMKLGIEMGKGRGRRQGLSNWTTTSSPSARLQSPFSVSLVSTEGR